MIDIIMKIGLLGCIGIIGVLVILWMWLGINRWYKKLIPDELFQMFNYDNEPDHKYIRIHENVVIMSMADAYMSWDGEPQFVVGNGCLLCEEGICNKDCDSSVEVCDPTIQFDVGGSGPVGPAESDSTELTQEQREQLCGCGGCTCK